MTRLAPPSPEEVLGRLTAARPDRLRHTATIPAQSGVATDWPAWTPSDLVAAWAAHGVERPWEHQVRAAELAHEGRDLVIATGTASGKSLAFALPALTAVHGGLTAPNGRGSTTVYLAPTKALAHDQLRALRELGLPWLRASTVDGDASADERAWARAHANYVLTNPDLIHRSMLPQHTSWAPFLRRLDYIVIDECHNYRGVFGAHVAAVIRRLRRVCERYGSSPVVIAASATVADPHISIARLVGGPVEAVTDDTSPRARKVIGLWQPGVVERWTDRHRPSDSEAAGERSEPAAPFAPAETADRGDTPPARRSATAEAADLLADLVVEGLQSIAFIRSRRGAEAVAMMTRDLLDEIDPALARSVASYRAGYLPEERRALEGRFRDGSLSAMAATNALELGIDISGLDAVITAGWPGTRASLWQQVGRAGRSGEPSLALFVARDDPLDTYIAHHPETVFGQPVEATVFDPENRYVLAPHLCAAASEFPLTADDAVRWFGPSAITRLGELTETGLLRKRPNGWFWTSRDRASDLADLRGTGGPPVRIVEAGTGRILGTLDNAASHANLHPGAVYTHQGVTHLVTELDLNEAVATVVEQEVDYTTDAREVSDIRITEVRESQRWGDGEVSFGSVDVTSQVVSFQRRRVLTGEFLAEQSLELPEHELSTTAVWWTVSPGQIDAAALDGVDVPGAAHAAEHASIGLLPLFATCDRWDIGGVSTALHPDTGRVTVFVYDGYPGGAGFAEHGYRVMRAWLNGTRTLIAECGCERGCPSCIQSPKCGNGNDPLDKDGAIRLLDQLLAGSGA